MPVTPGEVWSAWNLDPVLLATVVTSGALYAYGTRRLARTRARRVAAFYAGLLGGTLVLTSPLDALAHVLFSVHMVQHLVLIFVTAPLLLLGAPALALSRSLPRRFERGLASLRRSRVLAGTWRVLINPVVAAGLFTITMWAWHLPTPYEWALHNDIAHAAEHTAFVGAAALFWTPLIGARRNRISSGTGILYAFAAMLQSGGLGALLLFARVVLYPTHAIGAHVWGITPLQDQQLAGAIMWVPAGGVFVIVMAALFLRWFKEIEHRMQRAEARAHLGRADV